MNKKVKFVVAVGDVTDNGSVLALDTRATFAQALVMCVLEIDQKEPHT
jgi:hypothetical protein